MTSSGLEESGPPDHGDRLVGDDGCMAWGEEANGSAPPELSIVRALGLSEPRLRILQIVHRDECATAASLVRELGIARSTLTLHIKALVDAGLIEAELDDHADGERGGGGRLRWKPRSGALEDGLDALGRSVLRGASQTRELDTLPIIPKGM